MRGRSERGAGLALGVALLCACASNPAPDDWLPDAAQGQRSARGGWIEVQCTDSDDPCAAGELIAAGDDGVEVLTQTGLVHVPKSRIEEARLAGYATRPGRIAAWGAVGSLATVAHGVYFVVSLPIWLITTAFAARSESTAGLLDYPEVPLKRFRAYARFPQGRPPDIDAAALGTLQRRPAGGR